MTEVLTAAQEVGDNLCPYVGLRPFNESDKRFFFGRKPDAQLLRNKILSAPLTLFYAPSGVGKTSLLKALVIPDLNEPDRETRVVYIDRWDADDTLTVIANAVASDTSGSQETIEMLGHRLASAIAAAHRQDDRTLVLILDQFEQFLIRHPNEFRAFGAELATVVGSALDCHVVISLREEFLASLNVFRRDIPTLLDSTYRLEYLKEDGAREAIREPAKKVAATVEAQLIERILSDLNKASATAGMDTLTVRPEDTVELPFLQLICEQLWQASDKQTLKQELYDHVFGHATFIEAFQKRLEKDLSESDKNDTALVLDQLAPRAGVKRSYSLRELGTECNSPRVRVEAMLKHLQALGIVRTVETVGNQNYELYHDAYTRLLRGWIDERLELMKHAAERRKQRVRLFGGVGAGFAILGLIGLGLFTHYNEESRTTAEFKKLHLMSREHRLREAETVLTNVASYLWKKEKVKKLFDLLEENKSVVPANFGFDGHVREAMPEARAIELALVPIAPAVFSQKGQKFPKNRESAREEAKESAGAAVLQVSISSKLPPVDNASLLYSWRIEASRLIEEWGLPAPPQLRFRRDDGLSRDQVGFAIEEVAATDVKGRTAGEMSLVSVFTGDDHGVILGEDLNKENIGKLPEKLMKLQVPIGSSVSTERAWLVPRWTLPLWKAAGVRVFPAEYAIAFAVREALLQKPEQLLRPNVVKRLLDAQRVDFCETVEEVRLARGSETNVQRDLIELVRKRHKIANLAYILDALADYPSDVKSEDVAKVFSSGEATERSRYRVHASPEKSTPCAPKNYDDRVGPTRARTDDPGMPSPPRVAVRLELGAALAQSFRDREGKPNPKLLATIRQVRSNIYQNFGVVPLDIEPTFIETRNLLSDEMVLRVPWSSRTESFKIDFQADTLQKELTQRLATHTPRMLTAEQVRRSVSTLPSDVERWLLQTYSITDLKLILRAVIEKSPQVFVATHAGQSAEHVTLRHLPWLLGSLVFWSSACPRMDFNCLSAGLRETQRARLKPTALQSAATSQSDLMESGIKDVMEGNPVAATAKFAKAIKTGPAIARQHFLALWPENVDRIQYEQLLNITPMCRLPSLHEFDTSPPDVQALIEISDYLDRHRTHVPESASYIKPKDIRRLLLCQYWGQLATPEPEKIAIALLDNMFQRKPVLNWSADERYMAGYWTLRAASNGVLPFAYRRQARDQLAAAFREWHDENQRDNRYQQLAELCEKSVAKSACFRMLRPIADVVSDSPYIQLNIAFRLSRFIEREADGSDVLSLLNRAEQNLSKVPRSQIRDMNLWITLGRAQVNGALASFGQRESGERALSQYNHVLNGTSKQDKSEISRDDIYSRLFDLHLLAGRMKEARDILDKGLREQPDSKVLLSSRVFFYLAEGNVKKAVQGAEQAFKEGLRNDPDFLFNVTMVRLLDVDVKLEEIEYDARRFLSTRHEYQDNIRTMLFWRLGGKTNPRAQELIQERWETIDQTSWKERQARQAPDVWREKLIGYYMNKVKVEELTEPLANPENFEKSGLGGSGQLRSEFVAEFHFLDALLQSVSGDEKRYRDALQKSVESKAVKTFDYHMSRFLLCKNHRECSP